MLFNIIRRAGFSRKMQPILQSSVRHKAGYDGDGRTTVRVLNLETDLGLMIDSLSTFGFRLNNGVTVLGPMVLFPRSVLSWQVGGVHDVSPDSLKLLTLLEPRIDLVILGVESDREKVHKAVKSLNLRAEVLQPEHAASTYNFLMAEGRSVCAAMIPPVTVDLSADDMLESKLHYRNIFNTNE